jgi:hypothetical protein
MAVNMGDKSVYIRAFWPREISQSASLRSFQSNSNFAMWGIDYGIERGEKEKDPRYIQRIFG